MPFIIELCARHAKIKGIIMWFQVLPEFIETIKEKTDNWDTVSCDECESEQRAKRKTHNMQSEFMRMQKENQQWMQSRREQEK